MMRSLFSAVAGLKTHQTRMDVIGNNIANVNTTAYKSQSMVFNDLLYQTTQDASGANTVTGRGGINARQIGLGAKTSAIKTAITQQGSAQSTNDPFDLMITGESFFIVSDGTTNFFTRDGSFTVDGSGNLVMTSTGYTVMGWQVDDEGNVVVDTVSALRVMDERNLIYPAESTTRAYLSGIVDENDTNVNGSSGRIVTLEFFDRRGYSYTAKFSIHSTDDQGHYTVQLDDILDSEGVSLVKKYDLNSIKSVANFGHDIILSSTEVRDILDGYTYNATDNTYSKITPLTEVLDIPAKFQDLLDMATSWDMVSDTPGPNGEDVPLAKGTELDVGDTVTIKGQLDWSMQTLENLGVMWNNTDKCYEYQPVDANGNPNGAVRQLSPTTLTDWEDALKSLGIDGIETVDIKADGSEVNITFKQEIDVKTAATVETSKSVSVVLEDQVAGQMEAFGLDTTGEASYSIEFVTTDGLKAQVNKVISRYGQDLWFEAGDGQFSYIDSAGIISAMLDFNASTVNMQGQNIDLSMFTDIDIDFSALSNQDNGGTSTVEATSGGLDNPTVGCGRRLGEMIGIAIGQDGVITASYDNGQHKNLGQIAVATFANASGLSKEGDNLYSETINSGYFDGVGQDITADGSGYITSGVLEMSNVDLSQEFTEMITTQRGFQANSRIISVSDNLLEELVNLKR